jgi:tricorn protease
MRTRNSLLLLACSLAWLAGATTAVAQTRLLRFPDVSGDKVVFTYGGDLWTAPAAGGTATRLTTHPGMELFAKFSPDGKWIAFTGQIDGDEQVYIIPTGGGIPKQLTFYPAKGPFAPRWGYDNQVLGWTPDGKSVLFRSGRDTWTVSDSKLYTVSVEGGLPKALPMPTAGSGAFSPDMKKMVYCPVFRDFRTEKRYRGGWQSDLYIFDLASHAINPIDNSPYSERDPMWIGSKIYFTSDRTGTFNLYEYDPSSKKTRALTTSTKWDVRWPAAGDKDRIAYELDGEINIMDAKSGKSTKITVNVPTDALNTRPSLMKVGDQIASWDLSPKGERAVFTARGDIFTAPIEKGVTRNLTRSSGAHDKWPAWSPDGRKIAYISDRTGEEEIWIVNQDGSGQAEQLTKGGKAMRYNPDWSPDSKKISFSDKDGKLYVLTVADKSVIEIAHDKRGRLMDYRWSPDSAYIAYSATDANNMRSISIWSAADKTARRVTSDLFNEHSPSWDPEGNYLYYLSEREYPPLISTTEFNYATNRNTFIYALVLRKDGKNPFGPESDEVQIADEKKADEAKPEEKKADEKKADEKKPGADKKEPKPVQIDFDGLEKRVVRVPIVAENYGGLSAVKGHLVYVRQGSFYYGRESAIKPSIVIYSVKDRKETTLVEGASNYALSADGQKMLVRQGGSFSLYDVNPRGKDSKKTVSTADLTVERNPIQEWNQIFNEVWRRYRDFFYVENMHGYDWEALRQQYAPLLEYVGHRSDLNYVIGEMIAELTIGHAYIDGGDYERPERPKVALPGARFELDEAAGRYKIARIFEGQNEEPTYRSPLTEVGVDVKVGDYVLAIDGEDLPANVDPYKLLRGKAGKPVKFTVNSKPELAGSREATFQPISNESDLIYLDMVLKNRARVMKATNGRVAYIHVPNMGAEGLREFIKWYYPQVRMEALIMDDRGNGGGNVSRMLIERLRRQLLATGFSRTSEETSTYPDNVMNGPKVCLLNETSASDGDIFPAMFREAKLGPLIGKRSWGGVVGITNHGNLIDGGTVNVPEFGFATPKGEWTIEGVGVQPDIVVDNTPQDVIDGRDPQLEKGIEVILKALQEHPGTLPGRPADPVKTKK